MYRMACSQCGAKKSEVAYVISICCYVLLLATIVTCVNGLEHQLVYESKYFPRIRERRQDFPFPLDQIFEINSRGLSADFENDFNTVPGLSDSQDGGVAAAVLQQQTQSQLPQVINSLIEAAAVQQTPAPQQIVRTIMNSGLRR